MKNKFFKTVMIIIILSIFLISISSIVCAENNTDSESNVLSLSKGGLSIHYPSDWGYSESTSNYSIMAISKLSSIDASKVSQININFEKKPIEGDFESFVNDTYATLESDSSFELVSSGGAVVGDREGIEFVYTSNQTGIQKEHKAVWFEKGGQAYVLLYSAPIDEFESNLYVFDYILSDIEIT